MTGLLEQPKTEAPAAPPDGSEPPAAPEVAGARACASCGNPVRDGQDWCLECGTAQPGRLGSRPGWRAALTVLALTAVLVVGAVAAAYAALSSDATRQAAAPPPPSATPTVAQPPSVPTPAPDADATPTVPAPKSDDVPEPPKSTPAPDTDTPAPSAPSGGGGDSDADADTDAEDEPKDDAPAKPTPLALDPGAARTYDPLDRGNGQVGDPDDAIDGKRSTAWEAPVDADGNVRIGLAISLEKARTLDAVQLRADTPGFTVEVYATRASKLPPDVLDDRWEHIDDRREAGLRERVALDGKFKHVLLWITAQPADSVVAIPEVEVFG